MQKIVFSENHVLQKLRAEINSSRKIKELCSMYGLSLTVFYSFISHRDDSLSNEDAIGILNAENAELKKIITTLYIENEKLRFRIEK